AEEGLRQKPYVVKFGGQAGCVYDQDQPNDHTKYGVKVGGGKTESKNPYHPFSKREWEITKWAKLRGPTSTAFTELMSIEGVAEALGLSFKNTNELNKIIDDSLPGRPLFERHELLIGGEVCEVFLRDIIECIKALYSDPNFAPYLQFVPEMHFTDEDKGTRLYYDMNTGKWWWATQRAVEAETPGATIVPLLISTDKTQLTLFRNKSAYPIYLTIGNIPKEIRRKPSARAYVLLGYLPTTRLEGVTNQAARRRQLANLYHACMSKILKPLEEAGRSGVKMTSGDGVTRRVHPILACFVGDYPEQVLVTCTYTGQCPTCNTPNSELGVDQNPNDLELRDLEEILNTLDSFETDPAGFLQACQSANIKPVIDPFWINLPYTHIFRSITPDILHQLYQGLVKYLVKWVTTACGAAEIDARCRRLPPNHNIRHFIKGISNLSRVSGHEHDQMCRILLGLVIDIPLPGGISNGRLVRSVRALLDFLYLAQLPVHTDDTLELLQDALTRFHDNKDIFVDLGIREGFNLPKLHFALHYVDMIKLYGTTDNFNTEYTERLHIDLAKDAYAATNHKDEFIQMTTWLVRKEKVLRHEQYVKWRLDGSPLPKVEEWLPPGLELDRRQHLAKHPTVYAEWVDNIINTYGATHFKNSLARYVLLKKYPGINSNRLEQLLWGVRLPFTRLPVWHRIKYLRHDQFMGTSTTADSIHVQPARRNTRDQIIPGRFDTAWINEGDGADVGVAGYRVGRVRVIFSIPERYREQIFGANVDVPEHLAYIEWYSELPDEPDPNHLQYGITPLRDQDGSHVASIEPVSSIRRSVHLYPRFGRVAPQEWASSTVLDQCNSFLVNSFMDRHFYRITF
ncbi:hypothetical protein CPB83DRAFT_735438, partial [Crepidotus variabilis]